MVDLIVRTLMALSMLGGSIFLIYSFFRFYKNGKASENWLEVYGNIIESKMEVQDESINFLIKYKYCVNDNEWIGDRLFFKTFDLDHSDYTKKYPLGKKIKVFYNPLNPAEAVLEKGARPEIQLLIIFAIILLGMAYFVSPFSLNI